MSDPRWVIWRRYEIDGRKADYLILGLLVIFVLATPFLLSRPYYLNLLVMIGIYTIVCVGLNLLIGYAGQMSLGHAAFYGMGAYASAILTTKAGLSAWAGLALAPLITGAVAYVIGKPILRLRGLYLAMASFAFGEIMLIVFRAEVEWTGGPMGIAGIPKPVAGNIVLNTPKSYFVLVWLFAISITWLSLNLVRTRVGRALRALRDDEQAAESLAVSTASFKVAVFALSAAFAGLGGALYVHYLGFVSPDSFTFFFNILIIVIVIVGGMHSVWGALVGAFVMTGLSEFLRQYQDFNLVIYGLVLMVMVALMPSGLVGVAERLVGQARRWLNARWSRSDVLIEPGRAHE
ncbi:MAG: branched-chain amino acid ABC transporter permease [Anaerolineae bacterium]